MPLPSYQNFHRILLLSLVCVMCESVCIYRHIGQVSYGITDVKRVRDTLNNAIRKIFPSQKKKLSRKAHLGRGTPRV